MAMWTQFRRLLLGTVIEAMLEERVAVDFNTIDIRFDRSKSVFKVPRFDNHMRFVGELQARLAEELDRAAQRRLERRLLGVWPQLVGVVTIPIGDKLTPDKNHVQVVIEQGDRLRVVFDLEAD